MNFGLTAMLALPELWEAQLPDDSSTDQAWRPTTISSVFPACAWGVASMRAFASRCRDRPNSRRIKSVSTPGTSI